jgi:hypothetical protein
MTRAGVAYGNGIKTEATQTEVCAWVNDTSFNYFTALYLRYGKAVSFPLRRHNLLVFTNHLCFVQKLKSPHKTEATQTEVCAASI